MSVLNTIPLERFHGIENDLFVIDADDPTPDCPVFVRVHCDCEAGITPSESERRDADGVLFLALESRYDLLWVVMTLAQPDGSVAAMCGNSARVATAWAAERTGTSEVMIDTSAGTRRASLDGADVTVEMGTPPFVPRNVPLASDDELVSTGVEGLTVMVVDTGVPYAVVFVDDVDDANLESVAPPARHVSAFPEGAGVTPAPPDDRGGFRQRTFERGAEGETQSCGIDAVAVVTIAKRLGRVSGNDPVTVTPSGGALSVTVPDEGAALLGGPAVYEGDGEVDIVFRER